MWQIFKLANAWQANLQPKHFNALWFFFVYARVFETKRACCFKIAQHINHKSDATVFNTAFSFIIWIILIRIYWNLTRRTTKKNVDVENWLNFNVIAPQKHSLRNLILNNNTKSRFQNDLILKKIKHHIEWVP